MVVLENEWKEKAVQVTSRSALTQPSHSPIRFQLALVWSTT
jgi:hypothetical protein